MFRFHVQDWRTLIAGVFVAFFMFTGPVTAQSSDDAIPHGPKIGAVMASALEGAIDQDGKQQSLQTLRGEKGLILMFSRSFSW